MDREPALIVGLITAAIALAVAFGAPISDDQREAIIGFTVALIPVFVIVRQLVFAPATVEKIEAQAAITGRVSPHLTPPQG
jgi:precorrin-3B methylase